MNKILLIFLLITCSEPKVNKFCDQKTIGFWLATIFYSGRNEAYCSLSPQNRTNSSNANSPTPTTVNTPTTPIPISVGALTSGGQTSLGSKTYTSITFNWPAASASGTVSYRVYASIVNTWTTLAEVEANGTMFQDFIPNLTSVTVPNLIAFQFYRFDVIARDSTGTKVLYPHFCVQMDPNVTGTLTCKTELTGVVTTYAGSCGAVGAFTTGAIIPTARYNGNAGMVFLNNKLYIADSSNFRIRVIDMATSIDSLVAGSTNGYSNATGATAQFSNGAALTTNGTDLYLMQIDNKNVRRIDPTTGTAFSFAGNPTANPADAYVDSTGNAARFRNLFSGGFNFWDGNLYIGDNNNYIRRATVPGAVVTTVAGNGTAGQTDGSALFSQIADPGSFLPYGNLLYISTYSGTTIRRLNLSTSNLSSVGSGFTINTAKSLAFMGNFIYVASQEHIIYKMSFSDFSKVIFVGALGVSGTTNGTGTSARFNDPQNMVFVGNSLYIADRGNNCIRKID